MNKYGVLIVNESAVMRRQIDALIAKSEQLFVVGKARNGVDTSEKIARFAPALIIITHHVLQQEDARECIAIAQIPCVIICDVYSTQQADVIAVSSVKKETVMREDNDRLLEDWLQIAQQCVIIPHTPLPVPQQLMDEHTGQPTQKQLLIIGSSTGGPSALQHVLMQFERNLNIPIVIIQHMPIGFTASLARRLHNACQLPVKEAEHNEVLQRGNVYVAPAGYQTMLQQNDSNQYVVQLAEGAPEQGMYKPSIDMTLLSLTTSLYADILMVMLTGMGNDGLRGCTMLKAHGGALIAEAEETCVVYGMPRVVAEAGLVDKQVPLPHIFPEIMNYLQQM